MNKTDTTTVIVDSQEIKESFSLRIIYIFYSYLI
jgi:hypothetical protein